MSSPQRPLSRLLDRGSEKGGEVAWTSSALPALYVPATPRSQDFVGSLLTSGISTSGVPRTALSGSDTRFARFLSEVEAASDKKAVVDRFVDSIDQFPLIESRDRIHFIYRGQADDLAFAGYIIGARQERAMTRVDGTDLFYYTTRLEPDARVNYLFIKDYEEITDPRNPSKTTTAAVPPANSAT